MASGIPNVIDLAGDTDDDTPVPKAKGRPNPTPAGHARDGDSKPINPLKTTKASTSKQPSKLTQLSKRNTIDLTEEDPLARLDNMYSRQGVPSSRTPGLAHRKNVTEKSGPRISEISTQRPTKKKIETLIIGSSDDESDNLPASMFKNPAQPNQRKEEVAPLAASNFPAETFAKVWNPPPGEKRPRENEESRPKASHQEKRRKVNGTKAWSSSQSRSSSAIKLPPHDASGDQRRIGNGASSPIPFAKKTVAAKKAVTTDNSPASSDAGATARRKRDKNDSSARKTAHGLVHFEGATPKDSEFTQKRLNSKSASDKSRQLDEPDDGNLLDYDYVSTLISRSWSEYVEEKRAESASRNPPSPRPAASREEILPWSDSSLGASNALSQTANSAGKHVQDSPASLKDSNGLVGSEAESDVRAARASMNMEPNEQLEAVIGVLDTTSKNVELEKMSASASRVEKDADKVSGSNAKSASNMGPPQSKANPASPAKNKSPEKTDATSEASEVASRPEPKSHSSIDEELSSQLHSEMMPSREASQLGAGGGEAAIEDENPSGVVSSTPVSGSLDAVAAKGFEMLSLPRRIEHTIGKYLAEMREDNEYHTKAEIKRSRLTFYDKGKRVPRTTEGIAKGQTQLGTGSRFRNIHPLALTIPKSTGADPGSPNDFARFNVEREPGNNKGIKASYLLKTTSCRDKPREAEDVPPYAHYVSLKSNFLAPNVLMMSVWPYFGEDHVGLDTFDNIYDVDVEQRRRKLCRLLQAQKAEEYVDCALQELGIAWTDVLRFLLDPTIDVGSDESAQKALMNKPVFCGEDFPEVSDKWTAVLSRCTVSDSSPAKAATAAILCDNFQRLAKFPLWHVARRSNIVQEVLQSFGGTSTAVGKRTCRVCLRFNCSQHGEMREVEESDSEYAYEADEAVATDLVHPKKVNYRKRVPFLTPPPEHEAADIATKAGAKKDRRFWESGNFAKVEERGPFYPCNHPGETCEKAQCSCVKNNVPCEKTCGCSLKCPRKFQGCSCSSVRARKHGEYVCFKDDRCACYQMGRECDADLCGGCGVRDLLDPVNRYDDDFLVGRCHNASIQRGVPKHTLLGDSGVHGMGLYAGENVKAHDFLGEYKGEVITRQEGDRRSAVYEHQNLSYLFTLNRKQEVDSTYYGNKIRFINHRPKGGANVYAVIVLANTVHRIGLFAEKNIQIGQELFFDYGPKFPDEQLGGKAKVKDKESAPHVRNANITMDFYDVEDSEDEVGNVRARKAPTAGAGRGRGRPLESESINGATRKGPSGTCGGARPGVGRKPIGPAKVPVPDTQAGEQTQPVSQSAYDSGTLPEDRLVAYNIADDRGRLEDAAAGADKSEDEDFEPKRSKNEKSEGGDSDEYSDGNDEDKERGAGGRGAGGRGQRGRGLKARMAYSRSFRGRGSRARGRGRGRGLA